MIARQSASQTSPKVFNFEKIKTSVRVGWILSVIVSAEMSISANPLRYYEGFQRSDSLARL